MWKYAKYVNHFIIFAYINYSSSNTLFTHAVVIIIASANWKMHDKRVES